MDENKMDLAPAPPLRVLRETGMACNSYLIELSDGIVLIDPSQRIAPEDQDRLKLILATHGHYDHIQKLSSLRGDGKVPFYIHKAEDRYLSDSQYNLSGLFGCSQSYGPAERYLEDGDVVEIGDGYSLTVIHSPGHTPGSCCLLMMKDGLPVLMFTGDTIFMDSIGRTDFPGGSTSTMKRTLSDLMERANAWPGELELYPGHGPSTTVEREKRFNPWLKG